MAMVNGARVRALRQERGWTQAELAARAGSSAGHISRIENNERPGVQAVVVARLAAALGTSTDYLLGLTNDPAPPSSTPVAEIDPARLLRLQRLVERIARLPRAQQDRVVDALLSLIEVREVVNPVAQNAETDALREPARSAPEPD